MPLTPLEVANTFITKHIDAPDLTHMKVQKLSFYAYGWWLGVKGIGNTLTTEGPQVWRYGPVFRSVYSALTSFGGNKITHAARANPFSSVTPTVPADQVEENNLLDWIWERYGGKTAAELSRETHMPGTPWHTIAVKYNFQVPPYLTMDNEIIHAYFANLARVEGII